MDQPDLEVVRSFGLPFWLAGATASPVNRPRTLPWEPPAFRSAPLSPFVKNQDSVRHFAGKQFAAAETTAFGSLPIQKLRQRDTRSRCFKQTIPSRKNLSIRHANAFSTSATSVQPTNAPTVPRVIDGEPEAHYVRKGGMASETAGRKFVCNGLMSAIGLGQMRKGRVEPPLFTAGDDVSRIAEFLPPGHNSHHVADGLRRLLSGTEPA